MRKFSFFAPSAACRNAASSMPSTFPAPPTRFRVTWAPHLPFSSVTARARSMRVAGCPAFFFESGRERHAKTAGVGGGSSSLGVRPFLAFEAAYRKLNEPLNTPLCALKLPLPSLSLPSQTATALLVA